METSAATRLRFRLLGPLEVLRDGEPIALGGERQRGLLALLLIHANELMTTERLAPELKALVEDSPFQERLRGQLMLALYRSGRQTDALEVYRRTRELLADELGLEPNRALQQLERAMLLQDPALEAASAGASV